MREDTVVQLRQPGSFEDDPLTEVLRLGARRLLGQAVEAEVAGFVEAYAHLTDSAGRRRIVRHGHLPEREIQTGIGPIAVRCPRVRDRGAGETGPRVRFTSRILPPYLRRAKSIEELLPWLYLKGISTGDFCEALAALLGPEAPGLSASTIARLKEVWQGELEHGFSETLAGQRRRWAGCGVRATLSPFRAQRDGVGHARVDDGDAALDLVLDRACGAVLRGARDRLAHRGGADPPHHLCGSAFTRQSAGKRAGGAGCGRPGGNPGVERLPPHAIGGPAVEPGAVHRRLKHLPAGVGAVRQRFTARRVAALSFTKRRSEPFPLYQPLPGSRNPYACSPLLCPCAMCHVPRMLLRGDEGTQQRGYQAAQHIKKS